MKYATFFFLKMNFEDLSCIIDTWNMCLMKDEHWL